LIRVRSVYFDRGIWSFLIGVWPIYQSNCIPNTFQIFITNTYQIPISLSGRVTEDCLCTTTLFGSSVKLLIHYEAAILFYIDCGTRPCIYYVLPSPCCMLQLCYSCNGWPTKSFHYFFQWLFCCLAIAIFGHFPTILLPREQKHYCTGWQKNWGFWNSFFHIKYESKKKCVFKILSKVFSRAFYFSCGNFSQKMLLCWCCCG
jgi:hypothetical protein